MPSPRSETDPCPTVAFRTVGCRLNQCETAQMQEALSADGFSVVEWDENADVRVVNTCTVTARSDRTCRHEIHAAKRLDPDCLVAAVGCFPQVAPDALAAVSGIDLMLGNLDKQELARHLREAMRARATARRAAPTSGPTISVTPYPEHPTFETASFAHFHGRTRAFLKVQTGCDSHCTYCIVPLARGPARSMSQADAVRQVQLLASQGYREIVLTGVDLGSWGKDTGEGTLASLLDTLLREAPDVGRLRLSSVEPLEVDADLLDVVERAGDRVARHFHLPLQSGSDTILRAMNRPYSAAQYMETAQRLARRLPDAAIGADIIVGFPGETEAEFAETLALVEASPLTYLHVFAYSDRPGTPAAEMTAKVKPEVIKERSERLRLLGTTKREAFRDRLVGSEQRVLVLEEHAEDRRLVGLTGNYVEVLVDADDARTLVNRFVRARLERVSSGGRLEVTVLEVES